ncbi:DNA repair exonuclease [uncultured Mediterranean phage]|nr:DNA repair exonuclease [uncultured Mediterranean phage]|tara:strand:+ start:40 stop:1080 length:1041 start_codon:yes stop_codon:yes gene_type:complete
MKIAIITDQHFGARKNSKHFHEYFLKFYEDVFFPTIEREGITTVIDMGDTFDSRKGVDFSCLGWAKINYFDRLKELGCTVHSIVGNHTAYYKNTNEVNAIDLLLREYGNVNIYSETTPIEVGGLSILLVPWINSENEERTMAMINKTRSPVCMGHLECKGFRIHRGYVMEQGTDINVFDKFDKVYSGHYHTRSDNGKIFYLGNPYEMFWNDLNDTRGFHLFDTETLEHTPIDNPYRMFYNIYYEDTNYQTFDTREYEDKIVKVIVRKKTNPKKFEKFIDKLYNSNVYELKVVENFQLQESEDFEAFESEDTLSILNRYIEESEINLDKARVQEMIQSVYQEACELV